MSNHISVSVRIRPLLPSETGESSDGLRSIIRQLDENVLVFDPSEDSSNSRGSKLKHPPAPGAKRNREQRFAFDRVFSEHSSQEDVFNGTTRPLIPLLLDGFNATVFAYGATGCGKTHTISGSHSDPGIIHRTFQDLFAKIDELTQSPSVQISITVSYLEVYNETIRDLLCLSNASATSTSYAQPLDLREDDENKRVTVAGLSEHTPQTVDQVLSLMELGNTNRIKAFTHANAVSSRSHAVLQVYIRRRDGLVDSETTAETGGGEGATVPSGVVAETWKTATLSIIDLAGSERASSTKNKGKRLLEGANINRSLLALGNCINALCSDKPNHIPYRDSKLTRLLKYSLGGSCKVVMITNISPSSLHFEETHNTLKYANRAKNIQTKVQQNAVNVELHISQYPKMIAALRNEIQVLKRQLEESRGSGGSLSMNGVASDNGRCLRTAVESNTGSLPSLPAKASVDDLFDREMQLLLKQQSQPQDHVRSEIPASSVSQQRSEFHNLRTLNTITTKLAGLYSKIESKQEIIVTSESRVERNEARMAVLTRILECIIASFRKEMTVDKNTNDDRHAISNALTIAIDKLCAENVRLRHNGAEYTAAMDRYRQKISNVLQGNASSLSLLYKEKLEEHVAGLDAKCVNARNAVLVRILRERCVEAEEAALLSVAESAVKVVFGERGGSGNDSAMGNLWLHFLEGAFGIKCIPLFSNADQAVVAGKPISVLETGPEEDLSWSVDEDSMSECDVSLAYDSMSETESECGEAEQSMGVMGNLLDEMEEDRQLQIAFESCSKQNGGFSSRDSAPPAPPVSEAQPICMQTPVKAKTISESEVDEPEDEPTPMAKVVLRDAFLPIESPAICLLSGRKIPAAKSSGQLSVASSVTKTPIASLKLCGAHVPPSAEPVLQLHTSNNTGTEELVGPTMSTRLRSKQSLLPVMKSRGTPTKRGDTTFTPQVSTAASSYFPVPNTLNILSTGGTATRSLRKQGAIRSETPTRVIPSTAVRSRVGRVIVPPASTRVLRSNSSVQQQQQPQLLMPPKRGAAGSTVKATSEKVSTVEPHGMKRSASQSVVDGGRDGKSGTRGSKRRA